MTFIYKNKRNILIAIALLAIVFYISFSRSKIDVYKKEDNKNIVEKIIEKIEVPKTTDYIEIVNSCGPHFEGSCVNLRSDAGTTSKKLLQLRNGMMLKVENKIEIDNAMWYKVYFDEYVRYPERLSKNMYVSSDYAKLLSVIDEKEEVASTTKKIVIDLSEQNLYAYDGDEIFMEIKVSTGLKDTPTPRGNFTIFSKTPSRYMQGPLPGISEQAYDLPGVPWTMYFTKQGGAIHGAYWHEKFGEKWSHGCVNLKLDEAEKLYKWAPLGTKVIVRD